MIVIKADEFQTIKRGSTMKYYFRLKRALRKFRRKAKRRPEILIPLVTIILIRNIFNTTEMSYYSDLSLSMVYIFITGIIAAIFGLKYKQQIRAIIAKIIYGK